MWALHLTCKYSSSAVVFTGSAIAPTLAGSPVLLRNHQMSIKDGLSYSRNDSDSVRDDRGTDRLHKRSKCLTLRSSDLAASFFTCLQW